MKEVTSRCLMRYGLLRSIQQTLLFAAQMAEDDDVKSWCVTVAAQMELLLRDEARKFRNKGHDVPA